MKNSSVVTPPPIHINGKGSREVSCLFRRKQMQKADFPPETMQNLSFPAERRVREAALGPEMTSAGLKTLIFKGAG